MKKICIIGNSHTAILIDGWKLVKDDFPTLSCDFYAVRNGNDNNIGLKCLRNENHCLKGFNRHMGDTSYADLHKYDAFVLYGVLWSPIHFFSLQSNNSYSSQLKKVIITERVLTSNGLSVLEKIRESVDTPVLIASHPYPPANKKAKGISQEDYINSIDLINQELVKFGAIYLPRPRETLTDRYLTHNHFFKEDMVHLNDKTAIVSIRSLLDRISM